MAAEFLIDPKAQDIRRKSMQAACLSCHDSLWVRAHWQRFENTIQKTNGNILIATGIMGDIWQGGYADLKTSPFDEAIEKKWTDTWQFYANSIRFASAMGGGGDYGVYADGRYQLIQAVQEMNDWLNLQQKLSTSSKK